GAPVVVRIGLSIPAVLMLMIACVLVTATSTLYVTRAEVETPAISAVDAPPSPEVVRALARPDPEIRAEETPASRAPHPWPSVHAARKIPRAEESAPAVPAADGVRDRIGRLRARCVALRAAAPSRSKEIDQILSDATLWERSEDRVRAIETLD